MMFNIVWDDDFPDQIFNYLLDCKHSGINILFGALKHTILFCLNLNVTLQYDTMTKKGKEEKEEKHQYPCGACVLFLNGVLWKCGIGDKTALHQAMTQTYVKSN